MPEQQESAGGTAARPGLTVLHAGALTNLLGNGLGPAFERATGIPVRPVRGHSVALADGIKDGSRVGDIFMSADAEVNGQLIGAANGDWVRWFVVFARNAVVLAYSPRGRFTAEFERVRRGEAPWYDVLGRPGLRLRRNDPDSDPLGYYTILVCQLAEWHYGLPGLQGRLLGPARNPEQVGAPDVAGLARGDLDAAFLYQTAAQDSGLPFLTLPPSINLGEPDLAVAYARASHTTADGRIFRGVPIRFSATVLARTARADLAQRFLTYLLLPAGQELMRAYYFLPSPVLVGGDEVAVPEALRPFSAGRYPTAARGWR